MSMSFGSFFSSSNGVSNQNFLTDYASIRNGSYAKLLRSYYGKTNSSASTSGSKSSSGSSSGYVLDRILEERRNPKVSKEVNEANSNLPSKISKLSNSVSALQNEKTYEDTENGQSAKDKVVSSVKDFVSNYNDMVTTAKKSTMSRQTSNVAGMMRISRENADQLKEMGITINGNGTLQLNEGKLKATDISKVQKMFSSKDSMSYGSRVMSRAQFASIASSANTSSTKNDTKTDGTSNTNTASVKETIEALKSDKLYEKKKDKDGKETYDIDKIFASAKDFVNSYNSMLDKAGSSLNSGVMSNLSQIRDKTAANADALKQIGISLDVKGKLNIDEDTFRKADMSKVQKLFKDYGASISTNASLVDYYMTTQANSTNSYTAAGTYDVQGGLRFTDAI